VLVAIGLWVRLSLTETPAFKARRTEEAPPPAVPLGEVLRTNWREVLGGTFGVVACFCIYYLSTAFALGYGTKTLGYSREAFLSVQLVRHPVHGRGHHRRRLLVRRHQSRAGC
jgi:hypothetical protein